jgi:hypothetical protein
MWPHYVLSVGFPDLPNASPKFWKIDVLSDCPALYLYIYILFYGKIPKHVVMINSSKISQTICHNRKTHNMWSWGPWIIFFWSNPSLLRAWDVIGVLALGVTSARWRIRNYIHYKVGTAFTKNTGKCRFNQQKWDLTGLKTDLWWLNWMN